MSLHKLSHSRHIVCTVPDPTSSFACRSSNDFQPKTQAVRFLLPEALAATMVRLTRRNSARLRPPIRATDIGSNAEAGFARRLVLESESHPHRDRSGWIPEYLRNPILLALAPQQADGPKSGQISQKMLSALQSSGSDKPSLINNGDSEKSLNDASTALRYLQNP